MSKRSTPFVSLRRATALAMGIVAVTALSAVGQVSIDLQVDGANTLSVDPGTVELAFDVQVTSSVELDGVQYTLLSSNGDLFEYAADPWVVGTPWGAGDKLANPANLVEEGKALSAKPEMGYFTFGTSHAASSFPSVIATLNVRSSSSLSDGTHTFMAGDPGAGFFWTNSDGNGTFDSSAIFTLVVGTGSSGGGGGGGGALPLDTDGDGVADTADICPGSDDNEDTDGDAVPDGCDNCPNDANADQTDTDEDGFGDPCDQQDDTQDQPDTGDDSTDDDTGDGDTDDDDGADDGTDDDGTGDDGTGDDVTDDGQDDGSVVAPPCGAGLAELSVMSLMSLYLVQRSRRRRNS